MKPSRIAFEHHWVKVKGKRARNDLQRHPAQPQTYISDLANRHWVTWQAAQQRKPLTDEQIFVIKHNWITTPFVNHLDFARAIEAAHGIKE